MARLNIISHCGTPLADQAFAAFCQLDRQSSFHYHFARLVEILYCLESIDRLLDEPDILSEHVRAHAIPNNNEGIGAQQQ